MFEDWLEGVGRGVSSISNWSPSLPFFLFALSFSFLLFFLSLALSVWALQAALSSRTGSKSLWEKVSYQTLHLWPQGSKVGQLQRTFPEATCILPSLRWVLKEGETWTQLITRLHLSPSRLSKEIRPKKSFEVNCQALESVYLEDRDHMCHPKVFLDLFRLFQK